MAKKSGLIILSIFGLIFLNPGLFFAQEPVSEGEVDWMWGEVVSVDKQKNEILLKYLDYDKDQEKEAAITVNEQTTYENVKSLDEIKPTDTVSVDYTLSLGKNVAKAISVEKTEETPAPAASPAP